MNNNKVKFEYLLMSRGLLIGLTLFTKNLNCEKISFPSFPKSDTNLYITTKMCDLSYLL